MYNVDSLKQGIVQAGKNIKMFEEAIQKERDTIKEYEGFIEVIRQKEITDAKKNVEIDAQKDTDVEIG